MIFRDGSSRWAWKGLTLPVGYDCPRPQHRPGPRPSPWASPCVPHTGSTTAGVVLTPGRDGGRQQACGGRNAWRRAPPPTGVFRHSPQPPGPQSADTTPFLPSQSSLCPLISQTRSRPPSLRLVFIFGVTGSSPPRVRAPRLRRSLRCLQD